MKSSARDETESRFRKAKGKIKEIAGKIFKTPGLEVKGKDEKLDGKFQGKINRIKKIVGKYTQKHS